MSPEIRDNNLLKTQAFPAAAANNSSASLQIGGGSKYGRRAQLELVAELPAGLALVEAKKITITPQHSDDDSSFAQVPQLAPVVVTGKTGNGLPTADGAGFEVLQNGGILVAWPCPRKLKPFVRLNVAVETGGGTLTASEYVFSVVGY